MDLEGFKGILKDVKGFLGILMDLKGFQGFFLDFEGFWGILGITLIDTLFKFVWLCLNYAAMHKFCVCYTMLEDMFMLCLKACFYYIYSMFEHTFTPCRVLKNLVLLCLETCRTNVWKHLCFMSEDIFTPLWKIC